MSDLLGVVSLAALNTVGPARQDRRVDVRLATAIRSRVVLEERGANSRPLVEGNERRVGLGKKFNKTHARVVHSDRPRSGTC